MSSSRKRMVRKTYYKWVDSMRSKGATPTDIFWTVFYYIGLLAVEAEMTREKFLEHAAAAYDIYAKSGGEEEAPDESEEGGEALLERAREGSS